MADGTKEDLSDLSKDKKGENKEGGPSSDRTTQQNVPAANQPKSGKGSQQGKGGSGKPKGGKRQEKPQQQKGNLQRGTKGEKPTSGKGEKQMSNKEEKPSADARGDGGEQPQKTKAELKAERRAKQEAQRAAKTQKQTEAGVKHKTSTEGTHRVQVAHDLQADDEKVQKKVAKKLARQQAKKNLIHSIDKFIQEKIALAGVVISESYARTKINDEDVILTYACLLTRQAMLQSKARNYLHTVGL